MFKNLNIKDIGISGHQSEVIELALSYGFSGIDLDMVDFSEQVRAFGLAHARRLIDSAKIRIGSFRLPMVWETWEEDNSTYEEGLRRLPEMADWASSLGCTRCLTTVHPACDERPFHENFEFHRKRIGEIGEVLGERDIRLGLEFDAVLARRQGQAFQFLHSLDAVVALAKASAGDNVGVVIDLWQMHVAGTPLDELRQLPADLVVAVCLSDIAADADLQMVDETARMLPGTTGTIDAAAALSLLEEQGYDGPITPRASRTTLEGQRREQIVKLAAERLDELWQETGARGGFAARE